MRLFSRLVFLACLLISVSGFGQPKKKVVNTSEVKVQRAEVDVLKRLQGCANDSTDDGLWLFDTISVYRAYGPSFTSTLPYPGSLQMQLHRNAFRIDNGKLRTGFTYQAKLAEADTADVDAFEELMQDQAAIIRTAFPGVKEDTHNSNSNESSVTIRSWVIGPYATITLRMSVNKKWKDNVVLEVSAVNKVSREPTKVFEELYGKYAPAAERATNRDAIINYAVSLVFMLIQEGMPAPKTAEICKKLFQSIANRDLYAADWILIRLHPEAVQAFRNLLNFHQLSQLADLAKKARDDYYRQFQPLQPPIQTATTVAAPPDRCQENLKKKKDYPAYASVRNGNADYILVSYDCHTNVYRVAVRRFVQARRSLLMDTGRDHYDISYQYYNAQNAERLFGNTSTTLRLCYSCGGHGLISYDKEYSRTEYGIYNKYEYSGRYKVVESCKACYGSGVEK